MSRRSVTRSSSTVCEGNAMKTWFAVAAFALAAGRGVSHTQTVTNPQEQSAPVADTAPASDSLSDLNAVTFSCPKAGLNAAAREAAKVPSQGTYQFAYFRIINDSHHASYEIHFKSNYEGEADLRYCVAVYCQQGWDPKTKTSVTLISNERTAHADGPRSQLRQPAGACEPPVEAIGRIFLTTTTWIASAHRSL